MGAKVKIIGTDILIKNFQMLTVKARDQAQTALKKAAFQVANDAKKYCPVQTGRLRASTTVNWTGSGKNRADGGNSMEQPHFADDGVGQPTKADGPGFIVVVGTNVVYAEPVHDRVPYLLAAVRDNQTKIQKEVAVAMSKVV